MIFRFALPLTFSAGTGVDEIPESNRAASDIETLLIAANSDNRSPPLEPAAKSAHMPVVQLTDSESPASPWTEPTTNSRPRNRPAGSHDGNTSRARSRRSRASALKSIGTLDYARIPDVRNRT